MRQLLAFIFSTALAAGLLACSSDDLSVLRHTGKTKKVTQAEGDPVLGDGDQGNKYTKTIDNSGANFQVKDVTLLRSSISSCMGDGMLVISNEMLLPASLAAPLPDLPDAKIRFLLPTQYGVGDDILDKERGNMVDMANGIRTSSTADSLTDTYLRSLETVANVVAHNCSTAKDQCKCGSKEEARTMLTRCLPGLDPETKEMDEAAEMLGLTCADGVAGMRKAIASMLSSYAFASAR